ncbi:MAG: glucuronate isomerase [Culicoidibacterales bacterium]
MKSFMDQHFLLTTATAQRLYHDVAKMMPICDYHCHLNPVEIAENRQYENITQLWLVGDHYKWRAMRSFGIEERLITGAASDFEKFQAFAEMMPYLIGNPLYHWSHLELKTYFGVTETLSSKTCQSIWEQCNQKITSGEFTAQNIIASSNVRYIGTTDDPIDSLVHHQAIAQNPAFTTKVRPTFRPDRILKIQAQDFTDYVTQLATVSSTPIENYPQLLTALKQRITFFVENGCQITDHSLERVYFEPATLSEANQIFCRALAGEQLTTLETKKYMTHLFLELAKMYHEYSLVMQLHIGALRNNNQRMFTQLGADVGFDSIDDGEVAQPLAKLLNALDGENKLTKTVVYCLNPKDNEVLATMIGNFQTGGIPGKIQFGSGWWFNDQKDGMQRQLQALGQLGLLSKFIGMLTDSRSFLSYTRHDYFRRILCNFLGELVENGEYPADWETLTQIVEDICFNNVEAYLELKL